MNYDPSNPQKSAADDMPLYYTIGTMDTLRDIPSGEFFTQVMTNNSQLDLYKAHLAAIPTVENQQAYAALDDMNASNDTPIIVVRTQSDTIQKTLEKRNFLRAAPSAVLLASMFLQ